MRGDWITRSAEEESGETRTVAVIWSTMERWDSAPQSRRACLKKLSARDFAEPGLPQATRRLDQKLIRLGEAQT